MLHAGYRTWHSHCDECVCGGGGVAGHQKKRHYLPNLIFIAATIKNCTKFHFQNLIRISELLIMGTTILPHDDATRDAAACCQATLVPSPFRDMKSRPQTTRTTTVPWLWLKWMGERNNKLNPIFHPSVPFSSTPEQFPKTSQASHPATHFPVTWYTGLIFCTSIPSPCSFVHSFVHGWCQQAPQPLCLPILLRLLLLPEKELLFIISSTTAKLQTIIPSSVLWSNTGHGDTVAAGWAVAAAAVPLSHSSCLLPVIKCYALWLDFLRWIPQPEGTTTAIDDKSLFPSFAAIRPSPAQTNCQTRGRLKWRWWSKVIMRVGEIARRRSHWCQWLWWAYA